MKQFIFTIRGSFASLFLAGLFFMFYSCDKEVEDPIDTIPLERVETSITFKSFLLPDSTDLQTDVKLTLNGEAADPAKLTSGYIYKYEASKDGYVTAKGSVRAKVKPFEQKVYHDTVSVKVTPYNTKDAKITVIPVADSKGAAKSGAVAISLEADKAKKLDPANAGYYKITVKVGDNNIQRDSIVDLKSASHDITMPAIGYYLAISAVPDIYGAISSVKKVGGTTALTAEKDGRYFIQDTGKYEIKSKSGSDFSEKKKTVHITTASVATSLYLYTDVNVQLYNAVHGDDAAAFDYKYIPVKNQDGEALEGAEFKTVDLSAAASGSVSKDSTTKVDSAGYYKFIATGLSGQLPDSAVVKIEETDAHKLVKLEIRPILDLQLATLDAADSVSVSSLKIVSGSDEKEYKTDEKLGITVPTKYAKATLTAKIPSLPAQDNSKEYYYMASVNIKKGDEVKSTTLKFTLSHGGSVSFYASESDRFQADAITFASKKITFDYTKL